MPYCTATHVQEEFKALDFSTVDGAMTTAKVERFIEEAGAVINSRLASRFTTPITGTEALIVMRVIAIGLVAERVKSILEIQGLEESKEQQAKIDTLARDARSMLKALSEGTATLTDAVGKSTSQGFRSYNVDEGVEPVFEKDTDQW